jgi:hypothetical protein
VADPSESNPKIVNKATVSDSDGQTQAWSGCQSREPSIDWLVLLWLVPQHFQTGHILD